MSDIHLEGDFQDEEKILVDALRGLRRPTVLELGEYELGLLSPERHQEITTFLQHHPHAAQQLSELRTFLAHLNHTTAETGRKDVRQQLLDNIRVLVAQMMPTDLSMLAPAGIRGQSEGVYQAEEITIVVDSDGDPGAPGLFVLTGTILGVDSGELQVQLWSPQMITPQVTATDEHGNFNFLGLETGRYDLIIAGEEGSLEIYVPDLMV